jgi:hypothetical protein
MQGWSSNAGRCGWWRRKSVDARTGDVSGTRAVRAGAVRQERWPSKTTTCRPACADAGPAAHSGTVCASWSEELAVLKRAGTLMRRCRRGCR